MRFRDRFLLAKLSGPYGTDSNPTGAANAILTRELKFKDWEGDEVELPYDRAFPGNYQSLDVSPFSTVMFKCDLQGSGTAGTAPAIGPILRGLGFQELINATTVNGTAQAGSTTNTLKLSAGDAGADNAYVGFRVKITAGTGINQERFIIGNVSATKVATVDRVWTILPDATSQYQIEAQVVYKPIADLTAAEDLALYFQKKRELQKHLGALGTGSIDISRKSVPFLDLTFTARRNNPALSAPPAIVTSNFKTPTPVNAANTPSFTVHGNTVNAESLKIDLANQVVYRNVIGLERAWITDRKPAASCVIERPDVDVFDINAVIAAQTVDFVTIKHGQTAGKKVRIDIRTDLNKPDEADSDGLTSLTLALKAQPSDAGCDELRIEFT